MDFWFPFQAKLKAVSATIFKQSKNLTVEHPGPIPIRMSEDDIDVFNYVNDQGEISREMDARSDELVEIDPYWLATQIEQCDELLQNLVNRSEVVVVNPDIYRVAQIAREYLDLLQIKLKEEKVAEADAAGA